MSCDTSGDLIRRKREEKGLTQAALAAALGVSDKAISKWETGKGYPDVSLLVPLAEALGMSVSELLAGKAVVNRNRAFAMPRSRFSVCPTCGNVVFSTGDAVISCCGNALPPLKAEEADAEHPIAIEPVEDEYFVTVDHPMTKEHYISFIAAIADNGVQIVKLYPEGNAEARFGRRRVRAIYAYCTQHGLFAVRPAKNTPKTEGIGMNKTDRFSTDDPAYSAEARFRFGDTAAYAESVEKQKNLSEDDKKAIADGLMDIFAGFGKIKMDDPADLPAQELVKSLQNYITAHYYTCTLPILRGLGEMYTADERFAASIDAAGGPGTAKFAAKAIEEFVKG